MVATTVAVMVYEMLIGTIIVWMIMIMNVAVIAIVRLERTVLMM